MKIEGCVALVTGANRGFGQAMVAALLEAGATRVYAAARDPKTLSTRDARVVPIALDITNAPSIASAAKKANDVTLLVNNAGVLTSGNVLTSTEAELETDFRTNVLGTLNVSKAFVPVLEQATSGATIVNIASLVALASSPSLGGYAASKAALYSITLALRAELKAKRIDVLAALPGLIDTGMVRRIPAPKSSAGETARGVIAGIARAEEEIFPDPQAQQLGALWNKSHKEFERTFARF